MTGTGPQLAAAAAYDAGFRGSGLVIAIAVAGAESGYNPTAQGDVAIQDDKWGPSVGLWQIRSLKAQTGTGAARDATKLTDVAFNARSAWTISGHGLNWTPWTTFVNGAYKTHLGEASTAAYAQQSGSVPGAIPGTSALDSLLGAIPGGTTAEKVAGFLGKTAAGGAGAVVGGTVAAATNTVKLTELGIKGAAWVADRKNIGRVAEVVGGSLLILVALAGLFRDQISAAGKTAETAATVAAL